MLFTQIENARLEARKVQNKVKANLLSLIVGQCQQNRKTDDESVRAILNSTLKGINDRIEEQYNDDDYITAVYEKEVIMEFMPKEITPEQFNIIVNGKTLMDLHRILGPNVKAIAGKFMGQISAGTKEGAWFVSNPKEMKQDIERYVVSALEAIGV
ncbi:hypothetical protein OFDDKENP_00245 [Aeromonas phage B614]|nr:hypothetical protein OFDDKENP_00245 [Aeromonas phage B614]UYD58278.1 hypothetical protein JNEOFJEA_00199 [Aeromonas phage UP87]UYD58392.1 hypothetical protein IPAKJDPM_00049 [Aeromonas phage avDM14-QBC]UYD58608.1 hypothetical protein HNNIDBEH_00015 [Aeromonas phage avDM10-HWA]UYD59089.1 hypothetical protein OFOPOMKI_00239 [Aeromonas phage avDM7-IJDJ]UYD59901.1 hypothetical protein LEHPIFIF_00128 [Aeromonas phage avDM9-HANS]